MAYGSWINKGWQLIKDVYDSKNNNYGYEIHVEWGYRQDADANQTEYRATRIKLLSKNNHLADELNKTTAGIGVGSDSSQRVEVSGLDTWMENFGDEVVHDLSDVSRVVSHNDDGILTTPCYIYGKYYIADSVLAGLPNDEWYGVEITSLIPQIIPSQAKVYIKDGGYKKGKVFFKTNGAWKKVKKIYLKDGAWKLSK